MKNMWFVGLLLLCCLFLAGMGAVGGSARIRVPEPENNYSATITDRSDVSAPVEKLSFEGHTAITGKLGSGHVNIGFDKIVSIGFVIQAETLKAEVLLKDGKTVPIIVDKGMACYAKLPYGEFKIAMEDIKSIAIHGLASSQ